MLTNKWLKTAGPKSETKGLSMLLKIRPSRLTTVMQTQIPEDGTDPVCRITDINSRKPLTLLKQDTIRNQTPNNYTDRTDETNRPTDQTLSSGTKTKTRLLTDQDINPKGLEHTSDIR